MLDQLVCRDKEVGEFVNQKFVSLRVTSADEEWTTLRTQFQSQGTPTVVFLKATGEEIDRICGFEGEKDAYLQIIRDYSQGKNTISVFLSELEKDPENVDLNFKVGKRFVDRWQLDKANPYLVKVLTLNPGDKKGFEAEAAYNIAEYELRNNKNADPMQDFLAGSTEEKFLIRGYNFLTQYFLSKNNKVKTAETFEEALKRLPGSEILMAQYAMTIFRTKMKDKYDKGVELSQKLIASNGEAALAGYFSLIHYYKISKNNEQLMKTYEAAIARFSDAAWLLGDYANDIFKQRLIDKYDRAIEVAKKALEIDPKFADNWDTLARLYYEKNEREKAISAMEKAVELNPDNKNFVKTLEKFKEEKQ